MACARDLTPTPCVEVEGYFAIEQFGNAGVGDFGAIEGEPLQAGHPLEVRQDVGSD